LILKGFFMGMSVQSSSAASMTSAASSVSQMQQMQQSQLLQALQTPAPASAAAQEPVSKPVGNTGNNVDIRA
jgi:membrane protease subunit (stomatin/prohibitin family)